MNGEMTARSRGVPVSIARVTGALPAANNTSAVASAAGSARNASKVRYGLTSHPRSAIRASITSNIGHNTGRLTLTMRGWTAIFAGYSSWAIGLRSTPMLLISTSIVSPGFIHNGGF